MLLDEDRLDTADLVRLYRAVTIAAEYIDFIGPGIEGHHVIEVRVNEAWTYMREALRQEEVRVLMNLVRPHLRRWHPGAEPEVRIKSAFGTS
jgi:hypothetical protein